MWWLSSSPAAFLPSFPSGHLYRRTLVSTWRSAMNQKLFVSLVVLVSSPFLGTAPSFCATETGNEFRDTFGPLFNVPRVPTSPMRPKVPHGTDVLGQVLRWNRIAIDASGLDHTPPAPGENRVFHEQLGP